MVKRGESKDSTMNSLFGGSPHPSTASRLITFIIPCIRLIRLWVRGAPLPRSLHYGDRYSRFQPMVAPVRANPRRHRPLPRW